MFHIRIQSHKDLAKVEKFLHKYGITNEGSPKAIENWSKWFSSLDIMLFSTSATKYSAFRMEEYPHRKSEFKEFANLNSFADLKLFIQDKMVA